MAEYGDGVITIERPAWGNKSPLLSPRMRREHAGLELGDATMER